MNPRCPVPVTMMSILLCLVAVSLAGCGGKAPGRPTLETMDSTGKIRLAKSYFDSGRPKEALEVIEDAIQDDPENAGLRNYYGLLFLQMGRAEEAEKVFLEALGIDGYMTDAHNNLGNAYVLMGRPLDAEREFRKALEDPSYPTPQKVYYNMGLLYRSQERIDEGISMFRKAVEIDTDYYAAHMELAATLESIGNLEEAASEYEVASPGFRNSGTLHYRLGFIYYRLGKKTQAREHLSRVVDISPGSENAAKATELLKMID